MGKLIEHLTYEIRLAEKLGNHRYAERLQMRLDYIRVKDIDE